MKAFRHLPRRRKTHGDMPLVHNCAKPDMQHLHAGKFDDPAMEIAKLSDLIKQDIQALNVGLVDLQNLSAASKAASRQSNSHSHTIVDSLRLRLKDATKDFQSVLQARKESLERNKARQQQFSSAAVPDRQPLFNAPRPGNPPCLGSCIQSTLKSLVQKHTAAAWKCSECVRYSRVQRNFADCTTVRYWLCCVRF